MANVYKNIQAVISSAASDVDMYTAPDETTSIVKSIKLYNTHSSNLVVDIKVYDLSNQKQISRALAGIVEQLNSTFLQQQKEDQERFTWYLS